MTELLELMKEGRAWSVEELAVRLHTTPEEIKREMEFLEHAGYLKRVKENPGCGGCSSRCQTGELVGGMPVFWELVKR